MNMRANKISQAVSLGLFVLASAGFSASASAEWRNSIGTGPQFLNIQGDQGWQTPASTPGGSKSVSVPLDYNPKDINDMMDSAFGFGGFSTNGIWLIQYGYGSMDLEQTFNSKPGPITGSVLAGSSIFTATGAEVTAGYSVYQTDGVRIFVDGGVRYSKQAFDNRLASTGTLTFNIANKFSEEWVDGLVGATVQVPFAKGWMWITRANYAAGGTEGTYFASTGVNWRFAENWSTGASLKYSKVDYQNGSKGDHDWYLYNAEETSAAINIAYNW